MDSVTHDPRIYPGTPQNPAAFFAPKVKLYSVENLLAHARLCPLMRTG